MKKLTISISALIILLTIPFVYAQEPYKLPPKEVLKIVDAPKPPSIEISQSGEFFLETQIEPMPSIGYMALPRLKLAGTRILPTYNCSQIYRFITGLSIKKIKENLTIPIKLPQNTKISHISLSLDEKWLAFLLFKEDKVEFWIANTQTGETKTLNGFQINGTSGAFRWLQDSRHLLVSTVPENRGTVPEKPHIPIGPVVQETSGKHAKVWTYQDLLSSPYDEELFDYYFTSQWVEIDIETGNARKIGPPGIYSQLSFSPNGEFYLIARIKKPYSYSVPYMMFPTSYEIWNKNGNLVHILADLPLAEEVPPRGVRTGARDVEWQAFKTSTLVWLEALDDGDPEKKVPYRDKIMTLSAPFKDNPSEIFKTEHRCYGIQWLKPEGSALITEIDWKRKWRTVYFANFSKPDLEPKKIFDLSSQDAYNDPGRPVTILSRWGKTILLQDKDWIYLSGRGASPQGYFPFLDQMNIKTLQKKRLFQSGNNSYESFICFLGKLRKKIITRFESQTEPPNYYIYNLSSKNRKALTDYKDPAPHLRGMTTQLVKYSRDDGVKLSGTLYLPPNYKKGDRLPCVIWAYPIEYADPDIAGQVKTSPYTFPFFRGASHLYFITQGYAILDGAQMPVVGDPKTMNDSLVPQLKSNLKAAIDKLDSMGVVDPKRVGIGGHSYGAFMTANLLAHSDLCAAGIARSGAYNRTLTPFGFQSERRTLWEAPELYFKVSPFMHAHKIDEPILLIHGEMDNNSGTFPIQSKRLFHALKGHGATARLVMLPYESHGYAARESILHVLAEMIEWFDKYIKHKTVE